ncbi:MAG TPA: FhaA domain-containing protein, partial [Candidatus Limnocylindrales bacterium]|nr:FhaA domain-containing protein [Candidatus Limnocylindrales bacterium]
PFCDAPDTLRQPAVGRSDRGDLLDSRLTMGPLAAVERFLERLFEGQAARLFHSSLRPIQVQRRIERAMESHRTRDGARTIVPHHLVVRLAPTDLATLRNSSPGLAAALADAALSFARSHGYTLTGRPTVTLRADPSVAPSAIEVDATEGDDANRSPAGRDGADVRDSSAGAGAGEPRVAAEPSAASEMADDSVPATEPRLPPSGATAVFVVPEAEGPRATIREIRPDQSSRSIDLDGRALTIGRAPDNGLVLRDPRASRHHARIDVRRGALVLTDLGSTNGSFVNDRRVASVALGEGDRVRIGTTTLVIEALERAPGQIAPPPIPSSAGGRASPDSAWGQEADGAATPR